MEESGVFEYWFAFLFALGFCVWFPTYVVKTKGQGISTWGLALCIVFLFIGLPLLSISLIRDVLPSLWLSFTSANYESPSISLLYGTIHKMATLDQLYVALAHDLYFGCHRSKHFCFLAALHPSQPRKPGSGTENHVVLGFLYCVGSRHSAAHYLGLSRIYGGDSCRIYDGCLYCSAHGDHCLPENESAGSG